MKKVLIVQRRMVEYRVPLFERMRQRLAQEMVDLQVVYGTPTDSERLRCDAGLLPWGMQIRCRNLNIGGGRLTLQIVPPSMLRRQDLIIVTHETGLLFNYWLLLRRWLGTGIRLAFWGHGANFQSSTPDGYSERLKLWAARHVDWWFAYTLLSVQEVAKSGFPKNRITCLNNAIDEKPLIAWKESILSHELTSLREALGLHNKKAGIFLGSLHLGKRLDFLFEAADELRHCVQDFELVIVGDGPLRETVCTYAAGRPWVHWVGAKHGREKMLYMALGEVMLNPGLVGLNILDSFAARLPMVTTDCGIHSPEIAYLESGRNGLMTIDSVNRFVEGVVSLLNDHVLMESMKHACMEASVRYSLDRMVDNFCSGILAGISQQRA